MTGASSSSAAAWTNVTTYAVPPSRFLAGLAYDNATGYDLLFGGENGPNSPLGDTWTFHEDLWQQLAIPGPSARFAEVLVNDPASNAVILFGGTNGTAFFNDTWEYRAGAWTELHPATSPSPRELASAAYDPDDSSIVLFGGWNGTAELNDTWEFSDGDWTNVTGAVAPSARDSAGLAFDASDGYLVLFGGENDTSDLNDTWTFSSGTWANISATAGAPPARSPVDAMAPDGGSASAGILLLGGENTVTQTYLNDTWSFVGGKWTERSPARAPAARVGADLVWDADLGSDLLVDGQSAQMTFNDSYVWNGTTWTPTPEPTVPQARFDPSLAYDTATQQDVLFGGLGSQTSLEDTDTWTYSHGTWSDAASGGTAPGERWGASMAYDSADGYLVLFGGFDAQTRAPYPGTWIYKDGVWNENTTAMSPPARYGASMVYDSTEGYIVLFGGIGANDNLLGDTWIFKGGGWTEVSPTSSPSARAFAAMSDDPGSHEAVLFGGCVDLNVTTGCVGDAQDTWAFVGGNWVQRFPANSPPPRAYAGMAYDTVDNYAVLYGGANPQQVLSDTWMFSDGSWFNITPAHNPGPLQAFGFTYDPTLQEFVLMGGIEGFTGAATSGTTWELVGGSAMTPPPAHNLDWWLFADHPPLNIPLYGSISYLTILGGTGSALTLVYAIRRLMTRPSK